MLIVITIKLTLQSYTSDFCRSGSLQQDDFLKTETLVQRGVLIKNHLKVRR